MALIFEGSMVMPLMSHYTAKELDFIYSKLTFAPFYIELVLSQKTEDDTQMFQVLLWGTE